MKHRFLLLLLLLVGHCLGTKADNITVNGQQRNYIVYAPKNLGENRPLLISCHGMNQDANYQKGMLQIESVADTGKFVTVFPNGIDKSWDISGDRDIQFILALIDKMVTRYNIDRNCVYLSGFSMGGMFTYHAMNKIADKIAAFAPISGYPMWGGNFSSSRPVPIIHTHGTSDDVVDFGGVQNILNGWIKRNGCPSTPTVTTRYRNAAHITRRVWGPGLEGVEVVLMEMANKGHWISNDNGVKTGDEIWRFCKRFSLELKNPVVHIDSPKSNMTFVTLGGASQTETLTVSATASDPDGQVVKMELFDGKNLLATQEGSTATLTLEAEVASLSKGTHQLTVVATDDEGRTGVAGIDISVEEPPRNYLFTKGFDTEGIVPAGWTTYDGSEKRVGYSDGFSQGCRVFLFTGQTHDLNSGLYVRNVDGNPRAGFARFGGSETTTVLTLHPGYYDLLHRLANWNIPAFSPVTIAIEKVDGTIIHEETVTPTANIGNSASNSFTGVTLGHVYFNITETGRYQITFYTADAPWADVVVGQAALGRKGDVNAVPSIWQEVETPSSFYDLQGRRVDSPKQGLYIRNGRKVVVK